MIAHGGWNFWAGSDTLAPLLGLTAGVEMQLSNVDPSLYNHDLAPIPMEKRSWGTYNYASLWVAMSVCIPTYMLASGLIAGGMDWKQAVGTILLGESDRAGANAAECARGNAIRDTVSGVCARFLWSARRECAGGAARFGGLRVVWDSGVDRRTGNLFDAADCLAGRGEFCRGALGVLLLFLGYQYVRDLAGHRDDQVSGGHWRAVHVDRGVAAAGVDHAEGGGIGAGAAFGEQVSHHW